MIAKHPYRYLLEGKHIWLNHAIFNCDSTKVLWLFRSCETPEAIRNWQTFMYTASLKDPQPECILPEVYWTRAISHQIWGRDPNEILVDANWDGKGHRAVVFDETIRPFQAEKISDSHGRMAHMVFSPDGTQMLADSYPNQDGTQVLCLIDCASGAVTQLAHFKHIQPAGTPGDIRCDLHPRWSQDGKRITVDSIHGGKRAVYRLEL
ncbi:MAG: hypothetical protein PHS41_07845 [Victivallaceae bacterium]|nr:hypothetical protein [Victivallaceae bacterium]